MESVAVEEEPLVAEQAEAVDPACLYLPRCRRNLPVR